MAAANYEAHAWLPYICLLFSALLSAIPRVFGLQLWNLAVLLILTLFFVMGFITLVDEIQLAAAILHKVC